NESSILYSIMINSNDLAKGINVLSILAQKVEYQSISIQFFIEVTDKSTRLQLLLNNEDKTADPVIDLPIGKMLNITVKYFHNQTDLPINGSVVQLIGEGVSLNFNENLILEQFSIIFNTSNLGLGTKRFSIIAQATEYQIQSKDLRISINRIKALIQLESGGSYIEGHAGDNIRLQIVLNDTDFGGLIKGALVTFKWNFGQGELRELNNDGVYEIILRDVPVGSYIVTISAFISDDFEFGTFEITLSITSISGPDLSILIIGLSVGVVALGIGILLYQTHFKYSPMIRKLRKLRKSIRKGKRVKKPLQLKSREIIIIGRQRETRNILRHEPVKTETEDNEIDKFIVKKQDIDNVGGDNH
ncbi:MAG: hypothetical protein ACW99L_17815, partial [Promethearchaeota archaeon]